MKSFLLIFSFFFFSCSFANTVVWSGDLLSDGTPTPLIKLAMDKNYQIKVSGTVNTGKWKQQGKALNEDACFDFHDELTPSKNEIFKNSLQISVCDGKYHKDHVYQSEPFQPKKNRIHFWLNDTDYDDNSGALKIEIHEVDPH